MDGSRIRKYWSNEVTALLRTYQQFETLVPSTKVDVGGAEHNGEDGRYVEDLVREYLSMFLPKELEVLTGFVMRPAVKTGTGGKERKNETDQHSTQLDIIVYNTARYPVFQRFGNNVVVPPEGVIAVISVKKHLRVGDIQKEAKALLQVAKLCSTLSGNINNTTRNRGPFLGVLGVKADVNAVSKSRSAFTALNKVYTDPTVSSTLTFDQMVGFVGAFDSFSLLKTRPPKEPNPRVIPKPQQRQRAKYIGFPHGEDDEHLAFQFLLTGILSVYYDGLRTTDRRAGFTAFDDRKIDFPPRTKKKIQPKNKPQKIKSAPAKAKIPLGSIEFARLR